MKSILAALVGMFFAVQSVSAQSVITAGRAINVSLKGVSSEEASKVTATYPVSEGGTISLPYLTSPLRAAGLSASQLARSIEAAYREAQIFKTPSVQVIATTDEVIEQLSVFIGGQVRRPGPVPFSRNMTLYQAVSAGGGATEFGSMYRVSLIRAGKSRTIDLSKVENKSLLVEAGDTIEVPQKDWRGR